MTESENENDHFDHDHFDHNLASGYARLMMSAKTPAAVTLAPAP